MPRLPDHWSVIEEATAELPFRLVTAPARSFLNSSFNETPSSLKREKRPTVLIHPSDGRALGIANGGLARLGNKRGTVLLHAAYFDGVQPGVIVSEGLWPSSAFIEGIGINALTGADAAAPNGGAAFHHNAVWVKPESQYAIFAPQQDSSTPSHPQYSPSTAPDNSCAATL